MAEAIATEGTSPPGTRWWICEGGFLEQGGTRRSGPYESFSEAIRERAKQERRESRADLFIDRECPAGRTDWDEHLKMHVSDRGLTHGGSREGCVSLDCTKPSVVARQGDRVSVVLLDGTVADCIIEQDYPGRIVLSVPQ